MSVICIILIQYEKTGKEFGHVYQKHFLHIYHNTRGRYTISMKLCTCPLFLLFLFLPASPPLKKKQFLHILPNPFLLYYYYMTESKTSPFLLPIVIT